MRNIPPRTLILIGALVTLAVVLLGVAISISGNPKKLIPTALQKPTPTVEKTANISFSPSFIDLTASPSSTVELMVETGKTSIAGVQVEINYDPKLITNVKYTPPQGANSLFGTSDNYINLFKDDKTPGKLIFAIAINLSSKEVLGAGSVGNISFTKIPSATAETQVTFGPQTLVTTTQTTESILQTTTPLTIKLQ